MDLDDLDLDNINVWLPWEIRKSGGLEWAANFREELIQAESQVRAELAQAEVRARALREEREKTDILVFMEMEFRGWDVPDPTWRPRKLLKAIQEAIEFLDREVQAEKARLEEEARLEREEARARRERERAAEAAHFAMWGDLAHMDEVMGGDRWRRDVALASLLNDAQRERLRDIRPVIWDIHGVVCEIDGGSPSRNWRPDHVSAAAQKIGIDAFINAVEQRRDARVRSRR